MAGSLGPGHRERDSSTQPRSATLDDDGVRAELVKLKGIGPWTAEIYLLMVLRRPDAWPSHDLALAAAAQQVKQLPARPTATELDSLAAPWRPVARRSRTLAVAPLSLEPVRSVCDDDDRRDGTCSARSPKIFTLSGCRCLLP